MSGDRLGALQAWLAGGEAQLDQLLFSEQRQARRGVRELAPVEAAPRLEHHALGEALPARRRAHGVGRLQGEQRLVAVGGVNRGERLREMAVQVLRAQVELWDAGPA